MHKSSTRYNITLGLSIEFFPKNIILVITCIMKIKGWLQPVVSIPSGNNFSIFDGQTKKLLEEHKRHRI